VIVVDAMNVIGSVPDGWWRDRGGALRRLVEAVSAHDFDGQWILVVADGRPVDGLPAGTRGDVELRYASRSGPDAADDDIVAALRTLEPDDDRPVTVVTSDAALAGQVRALGAGVEGAGSFRRRVGW
jgi:predicted RNA-binding protein with PIN domain